MPAERAPHNLRTQGVQRSAPFTVEVDGYPLEAHHGESVLAILWVAGIHSLHIAARTRRPRGFFCGMGICFDCLVTVDGRVNVRACLEKARPGMRIQTQRDAGYFESDAGAAHAPD